MAWIETIDTSDAEGKLKEYYKKVQGPDNQVDNILAVHSLRPHTLIGHMSLYKNVLHHSANQLPKWFMEAIGIYVSMLNNCKYCIEHHFAGMKRLLKDDQQSEKIRGALEADKPFEIFTESEAAALKYAWKLTTSPGMISSADVKKLVKAGYDDGEILEINQVVAYFNYANRTVSGLGVSLKGDVLGTSPASADTEDWSHH